MALKTQEKTFRDFLESATKTVRERAEARDRASCVKVLAAVLREMLPRASSRLDACHDLLELVCSEMSEPPSAA